MGTLYALTYSPWSEKARWALDHHGVGYRFVEHVPMLGEVVLRVAARRPTGRVTVPLYVDNGQVYDDSLAIARRAEQVGGGTPLFPQGARDAIEQWNATSERVLAAGRARTLPRMLTDDAALRASMPGWIPGFAAGAMLPVARRTTRYLMGKYGDAARDDAALRATIRDGLVSLREGLARGGGDRLVGDALSYADIAMAAALQTVSPVSDAFVPLGSARRRVWEDRALASEFADLVAWRDGLYSARRRQRAA